MKILVCTDGSEHSQKALEKASIIAEGCNVDEVAIIHVIGDAPGLNSIRDIPEETYSLSQEGKRFRKLQEEHKENKRKILSEALKIFENKNIKARTILKEGHPSDTIVNVGCEEGFDMIVIGRRGMSGLQKIFLGSVSSAVVQEAKNCSVLTVN